MERTEKCTWVRFAYFSFCKDALPMIHHMLDYLENHRPCDLSQGNIRKRARKWQSNW